jgi:hypothetical protein
MHGGKLGQTAAGVFRIVHESIRHSSRRAYQAICLIVLICVVAPLALCGQAVSDVCSAEVLKPKKCPPAQPADGTPQTKADHTKAALACEWTEVNTGGVEQSLKALDLLTASIDPALPHPYKSSADVNKQVLIDLRTADPVDEGLYRFALGIDAKGQPTEASAPINMLDTLAKANNLTKPSDEDKKRDFEAKLFACAEQHINHIFATTEGELALVDINGSFTQNADHQYVALYRLLKAYKKPATMNCGVLKDDAEKKACSQQVQAYASALEILRAAFEDNSDLLAKRVAGQISAAKN